MQGAEIDVYADYIGDVKWDSYVSHVFIIYFITPSML